MELDKKQTILVAIYTEYQKDVWDMSKIGAEALGMSLKVFNLAVLKLVNERLIQGCHPIMMDQSPFPVQWVMDSTLMTLEGIEYVESKLGIVATMSNAEKVSTIATKAGQWGWVQLKEIAAKTAAEMAVKFAGL